MILGILPIYPCHATVYLLGIGVNTIAAHSGNGTPVAVLHPWFYFCLFAETEIGKGLLRFGAEWLPLFWCIDLGEPDLNLLLILFQDGERVTIGDTDYRGQEERREHSGFTF
ncbi:MAG: hypothetical protein BGO99_11560 [Nitrosospira sp. 56-18]|nr:MAG: hypothetical protein BGO99_11560 [Nitrosospira sp. 56-18]